MEPEKKTNWWAVAGIVTVLAMGVSSFNDTSSVSQPASVIESPSVTKTIPTPNLTPVSSGSLTFPTSDTSQDKPVVKKETPASSGLSNDNYYTNVDGNSVHYPAKSLDGGVPAGASARCRDGTYSFSQNRRGTCSHHGGVSSWL